MIKRLDTLEVAATNLEEAGALYQRNFGFAVKHVEGSDEAFIAIGDAQIRLRSGAGAEAALKATGEGLAALWLEADDVEAIAAALDGAGLAYRPFAERVIGGSWKWTLRSRIWFRSLSSTAAPSRTPAHKLKLQARNRSGRRLRAGESIPRDPNRAPQPPEWARQTSAGCVRQGPQILPRAASTPPCR